MATKPIHIGRDPYRYECPRGHTRITSRSSGWAKTPYYCQSCKDAGSDPHLEASDITDKREVAANDDGEWCGP